MRESRRNARQAHVGLLPVPALRRAKLQLQAVASKRELGPARNIRGNVVEVLVLVEVGKTAHANEDAVVSADRQPAIGLRVQREASPGLRLSFLRKLEIAEHRSERVRTCRAVDVAVRRKRDL